MYSLFHTSAHHSIFTQIHISTLMIYGIRAKIWFWQHRCTQAQKSKQSCSLANSFVAAKPTLEIHVYWCKLFRRRSKVWDSPTLTTFHGLKFTPFQIHHGGAHLTNHSLASFKNCPWSTQPLLKTQLSLSPWRPHASEPWSFDQMAKQSWFSPKVCISDLYWKRNFKHFRFKKGSLSRFWTFPWSYITKASRMTKKWTFPLLFCFFRKI